jgi:hypothetical protein
LPHAFVNFLSLLGWSPKNDREKMSRDELIELFTLDGINRSNRDASCFSMVPNGLDKLIRLASAWRNISARSNILRDLVLEKVY